jgi:hypothetical protein
MTGEGSPPGGIGPDDGAMVLCISDAASYRKGHVSLHNGNKLIRLTFFPKDEMAQPASVPAAPAAELTKVAGEDVFISGREGSFRAVSGYNQGVSLKHD